MSKTTTLAALFHHCLRCEHTWLRRTVHDPKLCPKCKTEIAANANFCTKCGWSAESLKCAKCQSPLELNAKFCGKCGTKVGSGGDNK